MDFFIEPPEQMINGRRKPLRILFPEGRFGMVASLDLVNTENGKRVRIERDPIFIIEEMSEGMPHIDIPDRFVEELEVTDWKKVKLEDVNVS